MASKARGLADLGNAFNDGALSNRNLIINGACNIQQRPAASGSLSGVYGQVDRMQLHAGGVIAPLDAGSVASGTEPYELGFRNTARLTVATAGSNAASDYAGIATSLESQNVATSGWNYTSTSGKITLSFWVKSSVAGTYALKFDANDVSPAVKTYSSLFTVAADTWTRVVKTINGDSALRFDMDSGNGLRLYIWAYIGTDYTTPTNAVDTWINSSVSDQTPDLPQNWAAIAGATFDITGVQLEVGDTATPFEHRSYGDELARCQRYYQDNDLLNYPATAYLTNDLYTAIVYPVEMRATPSVSINSHSVYATGANRTNSGTSYANSVNTTMVSFRFQGTSGVTSGEAGIVYVDYELDAEL